jgi:hypothetical protein
MTTASINNDVPTLAGKAEPTRHQLTTEAGAKGGLIYPEFMGHEEVTRVFGLKRTHLYQLKDKGVIKSVALRAKGTLKGRRLFHVGSIRAFLYANIEATSVAEVQEQVTR